MPHMIGTNRLIDDKRALNTVTRLAIAQALAGANASVIFATGAVIGSQIAPNKELATMPLSIFVIGMALGTLPNGYIAREFGRRVSFLIGTTYGFIAGCLGALAILNNSFALYCIATFFGGLYGAVVQSFRFAAADGIDTEIRPKALAWVMAGGVFAGILGPRLVTYTMAIGENLFLYSYVSQAIIALIAASILSGVTVPKSEAAISGGRKIGEIIRNKAFIIAMLCGVISYTMMNLMMTSAPLAMKMCGLGISQSNQSIEWHIIAMYAPSFFTGNLISKFGAKRIVSVGLLILCFAAIVGLSGNNFGNFSWALIFLGLGWNFGFVGASNMILETHSPEEKTRVQSLNDFLIFGAMAIGSFLSGHVLVAYGWGMINKIVLVPSALALVLLLLIGGKKRAA